MFLLIVLIWTLGSVSFGLDTDRSSGSCSSGGGRQICVGCVMRSALIFSSTRCVMQQSPGQCSHCFHSSDASAHRAAETHWEESSKPEFAGTDQGCLDQTGLGSDAFPLKNTDYKQGWHIPSSIWNKLQHLFTSALKPTKPSNQIQTFIW